MPNGRSFSLPALVVLSLCVTIAAARRERDVQQSGKRVMVWMCLQRCNYTDSEVQQHLAQVVSHAPTLSAVSFEMYNLGPNSALVVNNLTIVGPTIKAAGLETWPMVSSYPYPPAFLTWMREVFANPAPFTQALIQQATQWGHTGFNIDWEPTTTATPQDAIAYAAFLADLATELAEHKIGLSVDIADWNTIWNWTAIAHAAPALTRICVMSTYAGKFSTFASALAKSVAAFPLAQLGVGLMTLDTTTNANFTQSELIQRIADIVDSGVNEVDIWDAPVPDFWWPILETYVGG